MIVALQCTGNVLCVSKVSGGAYAIITPWMHCTAYISTSVHHNAASVDKHHTNWADE